MAWYKYTIDVSQFAGLVEAVQNAVHAPAVVRNSEYYTMCSTFLASCGRCPKYVSICMVLIFAWSMVCMIHNLVSVPIMSSINVPILCKA